MLPMSSSFCWIESITKRWNFQSIPIFISRCIEKTPKNQTYTNDMSSYAHTWEFLAQFKENKRRFFWNPKLWIVTVMRHSAQKVQFSCPVFFLFLLPLFLILSENIISLLFWNSARHTCEIPCIFLWLGKAQRSHQIYIWKGFHFEDYVCKKTKRWALWLLS